jgi:prephenate dehydrogenase
MRTVALAGVGLIGASFALALRRAGFDGRILGVSSPRTVEAALSAGVIDEAAPLEAAVAEADLVYLSQPVLRIVDTLGLLDASIRPGALVTDAGSTKLVIVEAARRSLRRAQFLGGHPMAGKESRGVEAAEASLFEGRPYVLTPSGPEELETPAAVDFQEWIRRIGARLLILDPAEHDRTVAAASHLPQLASTALASALASRPNAARIARTAGPGLLDMTRLALSPFEIWADILATNRGPVGEALDAYIRRLEAIRAELGSGRLEEEFRRAAGFAARLRAPE